MSPFWQYIHEHWILAFLMFLVVCQVIFGIIHLCHRVIRHANIRKCGWPPPHCDADGDFKKLDNDA